MPCVTVTVSIDTVSVRGGVGMYVLRGSPVAGTPVLESVGRVSLLVKENAEHTFPHGSDTGRECASARGEGSDGCPARAPR